MWHSSIHAGRGEVAQAGRLQSIRDVVIRKCLLDHQLAAAVRIHRPLRTVLVYGQPLRLAEDRRGLRKDEPRDVVREEPA